MNWTRSIRLFANIKGKLVSPPTGLFPGQFEIVASHFDTLGPEAAILDIGAGQKRLRKSVLTLDIFPFPGVDVVANAHFLPFKDGSFDGIHCDAVLEHVKDPYLLAKEANRVLRPGGIVVVWVPFIAHYHAVPTDYHRFTVTGVRNLFSSFQEVQLVVGPGPSSAVAEILRDYLSILLSFGVGRLRNWLHVLLGWFFLPWKYVDVVVRWNSYCEQAHTIAAGFLFVARKSETFEPMVCLGTKKKEKGSWD